MNDLSSWISVIVENPSNDINKEMYLYLAPSNSSEVRRALDRIEKVRKIKITARGEKKKVKQGKKSKILGKLFEQLIKILFKNSKAFSFLSSVRTTTAEIDCLLKIHPVSSILPFLRAAGTHIIGEAKFYSDAIKTEWVNELAGILATHNANFAILFVGCRKTTVHTGIRYAMALHAQKSVFIVPLGMTQLDRIACGENVLEIIYDQYVHATSHSNSLTL